MKIDFTGQVVVVTGASRGIGKQIAEDLEKSGAHLILTCTDIKKTQELNKKAKGSKRKYYCVDFTDRENVAAFIRNIERIPRIDACINNAGINQIDYLVDSKEEDWDNIVAVNLKGPYLLTRAVAKIMKRKRYGRIINISSIFGIVSRPKRSIYSTTKSGIVGFTKAVSNELAKDNILVNSVSPGFILTDLTRKNLNEKERKILSQQIPMGRLGVTSDISPAVLFLASKLNTYITGKNIVIDGGFIDA